MTGIWSGLAARRITAPLVATVLAATAALVAPAGASAAQGDAFCGTDYGQAGWSTPVEGTIINELTVRVLVGSDDIRSQTNVYAWVAINNGSGDVWLAENLNNGVAYPNGSLLQAKFPLTGTDLGLITIENISKIEISYISGLPDAFSSWDNWNMNAVRVLYPKSPNLDPPLSTAIDWSQYDQLLYGSGSPWLHRFKFSCDSEGGPSWETFNPFWNAI